MYRINSFLLRNINLYNKGMIEFNLSQYIRFKTFIILELNYFASMNCKKWLKIIEIVREI